MSLQSLEVNCHKLKLAIYTKILIFTILLPKDYKKAFYSLLTTNKWLNKEVKQYDESVPQGICQLVIKQLGKVVANG